MKDNARAYNIPVGESTLHLKLLYFTEKYNKQNFIRWMLRR